MAAIWLFFTGSQREASAQARKNFLKVCRERGWSFAERLVQEARDVEGRPVAVASPRDVNEVYKAIHKDLVAFIDLARSHTRLDPRDERLSLQRLMQLRKLLDYKAVCYDYTVSQFASNLAGIVDGFSEEVTRFENKKESMTDHDPRVLPFIPFDLSGKHNEHLALDTQEGRDAFDRQFGPPRRRRDGRELFWPLNPSAYHGGPALLVRGRQTPAGLHWDVEVERGATTICTAAEVWHLKRDQYLNVYPDMYIRPTREKGGRKIWPL